jgi:hypothetical protein
VGRRRPRGAHPRPPSRRLSREGWEQPRARLGPRPPRGRPRSRW